MAAGDQDQGYVPLYQPGGQKQGQMQTTPVQQTTPAAPAAPVRDPNDQGYVPLVGAPKAPPPVVTPPTGGSGASQQPADWSIDWSKGGEVKLPQPAQDWSTIATQNSLMGLYPGLTAQADAARKRLDPVTAASADVVGSAVSPTTLLNAVPYVGPELAGATHEGIKSAAAGNDWTTIAKDTGAGGLAGLIGHGLTFNPDLSKEALKFGSGALFAKLTHPYLSGDYREMLGALGVYSGADKAAGAIASSPTVQQAVRSLILGGTSAARASSPGPLYDQWIPGQ